MRGWNAWDMDAQLPRVALGHVVLYAPDVARTAAFYRELGMRPVWDAAGMSILELRGGSHLLIFKGTKKRKTTGFDLVTDDLDALGADLRQRGIHVGATTDDPRSGHRMFTVIDPDGRALVVLSNHTDGRPV